MRQIGWDVEEIAGSRDEMSLEVLALPHSGLTTKHINRGFVIRVLVCLRTYARRDRLDLQMKSARSDRLRRDTGRQQMSLLGRKLCTRSHHSAGRLHELGVQRFRVECRIGLISHLLLSLSADKPHIGNSFRRFQRTIPL
jgi:hypothetical protein